MKFNRAKTELLFGYLVPFFVLLTASACKIKSGEKTITGVGSSNQILKAVKIANPGHKIAYGDETHIFIMDPDGTLVEELADGSPNAGYVSWGNNSRYVYFASAKGPSESAWEAFRVDAITKELQQLSMFEQDVRSLGVSPDGKYLAISIMSGNSNIGNNNDNLTQFNTDLYIIDMEVAESKWSQGDRITKNDMRILVSSPAQEQFWYEELNWNPIIPADGNEPTLAYTKTWRYDEDDVSYTHTYTIRADGSDETLVLENKDQPIWDFTGNRLGFLDMSYYDFLNDNVARLTVNGISREISAPAFSPDGNYILFEVGDENRQAGMANVGGDSKGVVIGSLNIYEPRWSPTAVE